MPREQPLPAPRPGAVQGLRGPGPPEGGGRRVNGGPPDGRKCRARGAGIAPSPSGGEPKAASPGRWSCREAAAEGNLVPAGAAGGAERRKGVVLAGEAAGEGVVWWRGRHSGWRTSASVTGNLLFQGFPLPGLVPLRMQIGVETGS